MKNTLYLSLLIFIGLSCSPSKREKQKALNEILKSNIQLRDTLLTYSISQEGASINFINETDYSKWALNGVINLVDSVIVFHDTFNLIEQKIQIPIQIDNKLLNGEEIMSFEARPIEEDGEQIIVWPNAYLYYTRGRTDGTLTPRVGDKQIKFKIYIEKYQGLSDDLKKYCADQIKKKHKVDIDDIIQLKKG